MKKQRKRGWEETGWDEGGRDVVRKEGRERRRKEGRVVDYVSTLYVFAI